MVKVMGWYVSGYPISAIECSHTLSLYLSAKSWNNGGGSNIIVQSYLANLSPTRSYLVHQVQPEDGPKMLTNSNMVSLGNASGSESNAQARRIWIDRYRGFLKYPKIEVPLNHPFWCFFVHYKQSILGYPHSYGNPFFDRMLSRPIWGDPNHPLRLLPKTQTVKAAAVLKLHPTKSPACNEAQLNYSKCMCIPSDIHIHIHIHIYIYICI